MATPRLFPACISTSKTRRFRFTSRSRCHRHGPDEPASAHFLVHVSEAGSVELPYTQAKRILDWLKRVSLGRDIPDSAAINRFDKQTKHGAEMASVQQLLATAVSSIVGKSEERAIASLFSPGGTHALKGEFAGSNDFEVVGYMVVLPELPN